MTHFKVNYTCQYSSHCKYLSLCIYRVQCFFKSIYIYFFFFNFWCKIEMFVFSELALQFSKLPVNAINRQSVWFWCWPFGDFICGGVSCVVGKRCLLWPVRSLDRTPVSLCPASFCTPGTSLCVTPGISWLRTFHSNPLWWKGHLLLVLVLEDLVGLHRTDQLQLLQH